VFLVAGLCATFLLRLAFRRLRTGVRMDAGGRLREYLPIGDMIPGMAYLVRRLLENTSNQSWLPAEPAPAGVPHHEEVFWVRLWP
jgi:hypothetical protein